MKRIGLLLLLLPVALSEATDDRTWIDPATARMKAPRPDKSSWVDPTTKRLGSSKSQSPSCSVCKACPPCSTAPTHFARLVRRMLILFDGGTKKTEATPEGALVDSWEVYLRMEVTDQDKRFLRDFVKDQMDDAVARTDFYDASAALERILDPANLVPPPSKDYECHTGDTWEEFSLTFHAVAGRLVSVLSNVIGTAWTICFNNASFEAFLVVSCGVSFYLLWKALAASWPWYHVTMLALFLGFFISYFWMYGQLYEAELLKRSRILEAGVKYECAEKVSAAGPKWNQSWMNYFYSLVTRSSSEAVGNSVECRDYFDALYKNPLRKINPAYVFVELMSLLLFTPMEKFGVNYGKFQAALWQNSSWSSALIASIIGPVLLVVLILVLCGYEFNMPFFLGSVNPNRDTAASGPPPLARAASEPAVVHSLGTSDSVHSSVMSGRRVFSLEEIEEERQVEEFRRELRRAKSQVENGTGLSYLDYTETSSSMAVANRPARSVSVPHESFSRTYLANGGTAVRQRRQQHRRARVQSSTYVSTSEPLPSGGVCAGAVAAVVSGGRPQQPVDPRMREFIKEVITDCLERQKRQFVGRTPSCDMVEEMDVSPDNSGGNLEDEVGSDLSGEDEGSHGTPAADDNKENEALSGNEQEQTEGKIEAGGDA